MSTPKSPTIEPWLAQLLRCPVSGAALHVSTADDGEVTLVSDDPDRPLSYPVNDGVPVLIPGAGTPVGK